MTILTIMKERGFTLIELLVTVAIIGVLAAIATPEFSDYKKKAFNSSALQMLKNIVTGYEACEANNLETTEGANCNMANTLFAETYGRVANQEDSDGLIQDNDIQVGIAYPMLKAMHLKGNSTFCYHLDTRELVTQNNTNNLFGIEDDSPCS